jgi:RHS repeat-associated protein
MMQDEMGLNWLDYGARFYDPVLGRWHSVDPLAGERSWVSQYSYCQNNPIARIDPNGELDQVLATKYVDEDGNELLNTKDGSSAVVTVTDDKRKGFDAAVKDAKNTDDVAWNNTMKSSLLGFELSPAQENCLNQLNSDWSRKNAIKYWQNPTFGNGIRFSFSEAMSQWTNPMLLLTGASVGIVGLENLATPKGGPKPTPDFVKPTNPPQTPPTNLPPGYTVRIMGPTEQYQNGYWVLSKEFAPGKSQPINPATGKPGPRCDTHVPLPKGYSKK